MEKCKLGNPLETVFVLGHAFRRNQKLNEAHKMYWDGEWFCKYCGEKTTEDVHKLLRKHGGWLSR